MQSIESKGKSGKKGMARQLPVSKVIVYQSGVGYVEHRGEFEGDKLLLRIKAGQINDILKSLTVIDRGKGTAVSISLPVNHNVLDTLSEIPEQISQGGGILALLDAFRGARVAVQCKEARHEGRIVGVESEWELAKNGERVEGRVLTLMCESSVLRVLRVRDIESVELFEDSLATGLQKSLDVSLGAGAWKPIELCISMSSAERRELALSYIVPMPAWKPAYRLLLDNDGHGVLQAWAFVTNVSGNDWEQIKLSLVSGQPMSFTFDLYSPQFIARPDLSDLARKKAIAPKPQAAAMVKKKASPPHDYDAPMAGTLDAPESSTAWDTASSNRMSRRARKALLAAPMAMPASFASDMEEMPLELASHAGDQSYASDAAMLMSEDLGVEQQLEDELDISAQDYASAFDLTTLPKDIGAFCSYEIGTKLDLIDGTTALVNIIQERIPCVQSCLFDSLEDRQYHSYQTIQLNNSTDFALEAGPITIYNEGTFIGEGYLTSTQPGQTAQITYAMESRLTLTRVHKPYGPPENKVLEHIENGEMRVSGSVSDTQKFSVENKADIELRALIKRPMSPRWTPSNNPPDTLESNGFYYIPLDVPAKSTEHINLVSTSVQSEKIAIMSGHGAQTLSDILSCSELVDELNEQIKEQIEEFLKIYEKLEPLDDKIRALGLEKHELEEDREQIENSMASLSGLGFFEARQLKKKLSARIKDITGAVAEVVKELSKLRVERSELEINMRAVVREMRYFKF